MKKLILFCFLFFGCHHICDNECRYIKNKNYIGWNPTKEYICANKHNIDYTFFSLFLICCCCFSFFSAKKIEGAFFLRKILFFGILIYILFFGFLDFLHTCTEECTYLLELGERPLCEEKKFIFYNLIGVFLSLLLVWVLTIIFLLDEEIID